MSSGPESVMKKTMLGLSILCVLIVAPRSLAEDLISPIIGIVDSSTPEPSPSNSPTESVTPTGSPSAEPSMSQVASPNPSSSPSPPAPTSSFSSPKPSDSPTVAVVPTPLPPHAIGNQSMHIAVPATIATDPRAHSVLIPEINVYGTDTLLLCGYATSASVHFNSEIQGVLTTGNETSNFKISGPTSLVMASFNSLNGARVLSNGRAISSSALTFSFVALSNASISSSLCNDGSPSNTRTVLFRALNMDLNMVKDPVRLK